MILQKELPESYTATIPRLQQKRILPFPVNTALLTVMGDAAERTRFDSMKLGIAIPKSQIPVFF